MNYQKDHLKRNTETGTYAVRTIFDDEDPQQADRAWKLFGGDQIATGKARTSDVEGEPWVDLFVPPGTGE